MPLITVEGIDFDARWSFFHKLHDWMESRTFPIHKLSEIHFGSTRSAELMDWACDIRMGKEPMHPELPRLQVLARAEWHFRYVQKWLKENQFVLYLDYALLTIAEDLARTPDKVWEGDLIRLHQSILGPAWNFGQAIPDLTLILDISAHEAWELEVESHKERRFEPPVFDPEKEQREEDVRSRYKLLARNTELARKMAVVDVSGYKTADELVSLVAPVLQQHFPQLCDQRPLESASL